jgi:hypothetical protein
MDQPVMRWVIHTLDRAGQAPAALAAGSTRRSLRAWEGGRPPSRQASSWVLVDHAGT